MELTYLVRGADGKQYGPATLDQLGVWVQEGRLPAQAQLKRSDMEYWAVAQDFQELQPAFSLPAPTRSGSGTSQSIAPAPRTGAAQTDPGAAARMKSGASWFYWVAGLSLINSIAAFSGGSWRFILGLGITQLFDGLGQHLGGSAKAVVLLLDLLVTGLFILFGIFASKGHTWAFLVGMGLFALDGLLFLLTPNWLVGVGFHAFVIFCLFRGFTAGRQLAAK